MPDATGVPALPLGVLLEDFAFVAVGVVVAAGECCSR
jgi:hypothetical protein